MAKFKVGDKVRYVGRKYGAPYGKILTVVKEPDGIGRYIVRWDSDHNGFMAVGSEGFATEAELTAANAARSRNAVVQKALNAALKPVPIRKAHATSSLTDLKKHVPSKLLPHLVDAYRDSDGYWFLFDDKVENIATGGGSTIHEDSIAQAISTMRRAQVKNADTSVLREMAVNARWRIIYKNLSGPLYPYGKETYSTKAEAEKRVEELRRQSKEWGSNASYFVDEVGNSRSANAVVAKAMNASHKRRS